MEGIARGARERTVSSLAARARRAWRWAPLPLGALYLLLLAVHFQGIIANTYLDADTASAPVIGQLFNSSAHAQVVLGTFGWYSTLLFELATRWLPLHREIWEGAPYAMALGAAALIGWSVWQVAGRWAAALSVVLVVCAAPHTLHLLLSTTEHGPDWFCIALLGAYVVLMERFSMSLGLIWLGLVTLTVGLIVGVNAASDSLVVIAGVIPFVLATASGWWPQRRRETTLASIVAIGLIAVTAFSAAGTRALMSSLHVTHGGGPDPSLLGTGDQIATNFKLWWQSIAVLGNGDFFGQHLTFTSALAVACAVLVIGAVVALPRLGWRDVRCSGTGEVEHELTASRAAGTRTAFIVFWTSSAVLLTAAFLISSVPVDINSDRYLVGLIYAVAALIPVLAAGRVRAEAATVLGACVFALAGVISIARDTAAQNTGGFPSDANANQVTRIAARDGVTTGYAGYWDAAPITWASHLRVHVFPVMTCAGNHHLCRFYLHFIGRWYTPRRGVRTFLLTDSKLPLVPTVTPDLGPPAAVYHIGQLTMYEYPYDLATKIQP